MAAYGNTTTGAASASWGFETAEGGIFVDSFSESTSDSPEFLMNEVGQRVGFAYEVNEETSLSVSGEVKDATGLLATAATSFGSSVTIANLGGTFGENAGIVFLTSGTSNRTRSSWQTVSMNYSRYPKITSA